MGSIIDQRNLDYDRLAESGGERPPRERAGRAAPGAGPESGSEAGNVRENVNRFTGHRSELRADRVPGFDAGEERSESEFIAKAKSYAVSVADAVGFEAGVAPEFEADPTVTTTSEGMRVVSLQQMSNGIEVWSMAPKVWLHSDGAVDRLVGDTVSVPPDLPAKPVVAAEAALLAAVREAAKARTVRSNFGDDELPQLEISEGDFSRLSFQSLPARPMTFSRGSLKMASCGAECFHCSTNWKASRSQRAAMISPPPLSGLIARGSLQKLGRCWMTSRDAMLVAHSCAKSATWAWYLTCPKPRDAR